MLSTNSGRVTALLCSAAAMLTACFASQIGTAQPNMATSAVYETSKARDEARKALDEIDSIQPQLDRVRLLYERHLRGTGPIQSLREYLPGSTNWQYDRAVEALRRMSGEDVPGRWTMDAGNEEFFRGFQKTLDSKRAGYSKRLGLPAPKQRGAIKAQGWSILMINEVGKVIPPVR